MNKQNKLVKMKNYNTIETYKGYDILMSNDKTDFNISDGKGIILNKVTPYYRIYIKQKKSYVSGSCYTTKNGDLTYIKKQIDNGIQARKERALELRKTRNESRFYTYICNNVTIRVLFYGYNCEIFVNKRPLRHTRLSKDFTFEDVLAQVYYNTIAKYNVTYYDEQWLEGKKYANYINIKTEVIDLDILPIYEYINRMICLLYTSPSPRDQRGSRMPSSA